MSSGHRFRSRGILLALVFGSILAVPALSSATPASSFAPAGSSPTTTLWAYGNQGNAHVHGSGQMPYHNQTFISYEYDLSAYFGWHVILNQTVINATTSELVLQRTMAFTYFASYCSPNCQNPSATGNLTFRGWEIDRTFANVTTLGMVSENGTLVPALALLNSHSVVTANRSESRKISVHQLGISATSSAAAEVHLTASDSVTFSPALGLFPNALTLGLTWESHSNFSAQGSYSGGYSFTNTSFNGGTTQGAHSFNGNLTTNGNLTLVGHAAGGVRLDSGAATIAAQLTIVGPFAAREGFILLPIELDLFGGGPHPGSGYESTSEVESTFAIDIGAGNGHFGMLATATGYSGSSTNPSPAAGVSPLATAADSPGQQVLQGQPESVPQAQAGSTCLLGGPCPSPLVGRGGIDSRIVLLAASGAAGLAVAGLIAARRRPVKTPPRRDGPVRQPETARGQAPRPASSPPQSKGQGPEESLPDPLDHLW